MFNDQDLEIQDIGKKFRYGFNNEKTINAICVEYREP